ncbi:MAG: hypothetical protein ACR2NP_18395 [Pirellulaceae bacterium]
MNESSDNPQIDPRELQQALENVLPDTAPVIEEELQIRIDESSSRTRNDDRYLARFFGICVAMIGLVTVLPAIYNWVTTASGDEFQSVARWAWLLGFFGALHLVYSLFAIQIADYGALDALAGFLLVVTCIYGFMGMSLMLDDGSGKVTSFLQVSLVMKTRATMWCGVMFAISALACYLFGREALIWRRRQSAVRV